jgi:hypothetical protein
MFLLAHGRTRCHQHVKTYTGYAECQLYYFPVIVHQRCRRECLYSANTNTSFTASGQSYFPLCDIRQTAVLMDRGTVYPVVQL